MNVHIHSTCQSSITESEREITDESEGGIHKHQPTEQSSCDIYKSMGILLALKNNHALPSV